MSIAIYTITHVPFTPPSDTTYIPLQVGAALHDHLGYLCDDSGDNISNKNPYYSELTGLYWIWKNNANDDYIGLCHYRRYFLNESGTLMSHQDYASLLSQYDVILSKPQIGAYNYRTVYERSHDIRNLDLVGSTIRELYPDYYATFNTVLSDNHCYIGNLFVAPRELFCAYTEWLFTIFFAMEPHVQTEGYDDYHKRLFGFLSEQLLIVWVKHNHLTYYEAPFGISQEKAETITLKEILAQYIRQGDVAGAYQHLCNTLDRRPDLLLEMSDLNQDLPIMEHILNICRIEQEQGISSLLSFSNDLSILVKHFRVLLSIIEHIQNNTMEETELKYLLDCKISHYALIYILQNFKQFSSHALILLNQLATIYATSGDFLSALSFLETALTISETDVTTLTNIASVFRSMGQDTFAEEYEQLIPRSPMHQRILFFTGSDIPILNYISDQYVQALQSLGHTVFCFDKHHFEQSFTELLEFKEDGLDMAILLNNSCFEMRLSSGKSLWEEWNIPCYNILVDHPMYYFDTLDHAPSTGVVVCSDRNHVDYVKRFYPTVKNTLFLPTAGACLKPYADLKPYVERDIDVLFIGSYKYKNNLSLDYLDKEIYDLFSRTPDLTFEQAVTQCLGKSGITYTDESLKEVIQKHRMLDTNVLSLYRADIIRVLVQNGIPVTVYGMGWDALDIYHHPNFHYKGTIAPEEGVTLMGNAKIVLNQLAWFKAGAGERIFEAMLQGAVSLTDSSSYLMEEFTNHVDIAFYSLSDLDDLPAITRTLLTDEKLADSIRYNAYQKALNGHTWNTRVQTLLNTGINPIK